MGSDEELALVRERLGAILDQVTQVEDLEFVELAATLTDITFSEEMVVEFVLDASRYIRRVKNRFEKTKEALEKKKGKESPS